ncbi:MAG: serine/threonine protein kinase, partial [Gemmatimonadales bacterium]
ILGLIDSGESAGLLFYVMPYVGGQTLRDRLKDGPLPVLEALTLLHDIASALEHAHAAGVIHRDLKPENVLSVGGHAFLLDFGIAKLAPSLYGQHNTTAAGVALGTPAYMAPEQIAGDADIDHRADLYAWGLIAAEMLTGRNPAVPLVGILQGNMLEFDSGDQKAMASLRPEIPDDLPGLIRDCLAPEPASRPEGADVILERLDPMMTVSGLRRKARHRGAWMLALGATALVLLLGWTFVQGKAPPVSPPLPLPVAVAGFTNETGDSTLATWGRMAGDWITQGLQETGLVTVVPWPSALQATEQAMLSHRPDSPANPVAILREETGAGTIITGSYYLIGDSVIFQSQVTNAVTGALISAPAPVTVHMGRPEDGIQLMRDRLMGAMAVWTGDNAERVPGITQRPPTWQAYLSFDRGLDDHIAQNYDQAAVEFEKAYALDTMFVQSLVYAATDRFNTGDFEIADSLLGELRKRRGRLSLYHDLSVQYFTAIL